MHQNDTLIFLPLNQNLFAKYTLFEMLKNRLLYHFHFIPNLVPGHFIFNHLEVNFYHGIIFSKFLLAFICYDRTIHNSNHLIISNSVKVFRSLEIYMKFMILKFLILNIKQLNTSYSINISAYPTYTWKAAVAEAEAAGGKRNLR